MSAPIFFITVHEFEAIEAELKALRERRYESELTEEKLRAAKESGAAMEREECAKIADGYAVYIPGWDPEKVDKKFDRYDPGDSQIAAAVCIATAIRARGDKEKGRFDSGSLAEVR